MRGLPLQALLTGASGQQRNSACQRLGHHIGSAHLALGPPDRPVAGAEGLFIDLDMLAETLTPLAFVLVKGGKLLGSVPSGNAEEETTVGKPVQRGSALSHHQRMLERHDDCTGAERDVGGVCGDVAEVHPGVVDLADVAECFHAQRDVACPHRRDACAFDFLNQPNLVAQRVPGLGFGVLLDGQTQPYRESARRECALVTG